MGVIFPPPKSACAARQISKMGSQKVASGLRSTTTAPISVLPSHNCVSLLVLTIYIDFWLFPNWSHTAYPKISHLLKSQIIGFSCVHFVFTFVHFVFTLCSLCVQLATEHNWTQTEHKVNKSEQKWTQSEYNWTQLNTKWSPTEHNWTPTEHKVIPNWTQSEHKVIPNWTQFGSAILKRSKITQHRDNNFPHPLLW